MCKLANANKGYIHYYYFFKCIDFHFYSFHPNINTFLEVLKII